jgi:ornithine carbamoyltransferase
MGEGSDTSGDAGEVRHFLDVDDLSVAELHDVLDLAAEYEVAQARGEDHTIMDGKTLGMFFEKPSTRTRISFETGMTQLGGHGIVFGPEDTQLGNGEPMRDLSRVLSRYVDAVMARVFDHSDLEELAAYASVPVVNGLSDDAHPCQTLADLLTIREAFGGFSDVTVAWVGDGNNVARSFAVGAAMVGLDLTVATPPGYGLPDDVLDRAASFDGIVTTSHDPEAAVADADVVYTDVWVSMGQADERAAKLAAFEGFQVNDGLLAGTDTTVMHCLPAHRGEEITDAVLESDRAIAFDQAENRLHVQKALLAFLCVATS